MLGRFRFGRLSFLFKSYFAKAILFKQSLKLPRVCFFQWFISFPLLAYAGLKALAYGHPLFFKAWSVNTWALVMLQLPGLFHQSVYGIFFAYACGSKIGI